MTPEINEKKDVAELEKLVAGLRKEVDTLTARFTKLEADHAEHTKPAKTKVGQAIASGQNVAQAFSVDGAVEGA